jgi:hypothetical protein
MIISNCVLNSLLCILCLDFFNLPNPSSRTMALGSTQPLTEMSTRNISGGEGKRPERKADNLAAICEPTVYRKCGRLHISELYGPSRPVTGIAFFLLYLQYFPKGA